MELHEIQKECASWHWNIRYFKWDIRIYTKVPQTGRLSLQCFLLLSVESRGVLFYMLAHFKINIWDRSDALMSFFSLWLFRSWIMTNSDIKIYLLGMKDQEKSYCISFVLEVFFTAVNVSTYRWFSAFNHKPITPCICEGDTSPSRNMWLLTEIKNNR